MLTTERLRLERCAIEHAPALRDYYVRNRAHLERWEPERSTAFFTVEGQRAECERLVTAAAREESMLFVAFERDGSTIVALVFLLHIRRSVLQTAVIGYSVDAEHGGRGIAGEAAGAVITYAFRVMNLHRVETGYHPLNDRSGRVLRKLGFTVTGYVRDHIFMNGMWNDAIMVSLVNTAWRPDGPRTAADVLSG